MGPLSGNDPPRIGRYRLKSRLGAGGMGQVYLAVTPAGRLVALKVVRPELSDDREFLARFHAEVKAARRVHGLYTAELIDADPYATPPWLATVYVPGPSLKQYVDKNGPLPEADALRLVAGVAEALQAIHSANVVHRDLKPSNVMLGPDGPRVIDFGVARALETTALTATGKCVGTPQYMAPEQIQNLPVTPMIDVFALGSLAAYTVLGRAPFDGPSTVITHRVLYEAPDLAGCPRQIRTLIERCLAKSPGDRPQLDQVIRFCLERTSLAADPALPCTRPRPTARHAKPRAVPGFRRRLRATLLSAGLLASQRPDSSPEGTVAAASKYHALAMRLRHMTRTSARQRSQIPASPTPAKSEICSISYGVR